MMDSAAIGIALLAASILAIHLDGVVGACVEEVVPPLALLVTVLA